MSTTEDNAICVLCVMLVGFIHFNNWFFFSPFLWQSIGSLQKKYSIGSFELLSKTAPIQALFLLILGPFVDYYLSGKLITNYKISSGALVSSFSPIDTNLSYSVCIYLQIYKYCWIILLNCFFNFCSYVLFFHAR